MHADEKQLPAYKLYPLGDASIVLQFGDSISEAIHKKVKAFASYIDKHPFAGMIEYVPAYTTLTIYYNPWVVSEGGNYFPYQKVAAILQEMLPRVEETPHAVRKVIEIPVCYGGEFGPDLAYVASYTHLPEQEVVAIHANNDYLVYMIGFAPGFPYLGRMDKRIATPRKQNPRRTIPPGAVGIGGNQTGIYSLETPGGWQIIGRTPLTLFAPQRNPPSLLQAGDVVRFIPVSPEKFKAVKYMEYGSYNQ